MENLSGKILSKGNIDKKNKAGCKMLNPLSKVLIVKTFCWKLNTENNEIL